MVVDECRVTEKKKIALNRRDEILFCDFFSQKLHYKAQINTPTLLHNPPDFVWIQPKCTVDSPVCCLPQPCTVCVCVWFSPALGQPDTQTADGTQTAALYLLMTDWEQKTETKSVMLPGRYVFYGPCADIGWGLNPTDALKCPEKKTKKNKRYMDKHWHALLVNHRWWLR